MKKRIPIFTTTPTHILLQDFEAGPKEIYRKGTPVYMPKKHRKHNGFCCNLIMLDKKGHVHKTPDKRIPIFSKEFFYPLKNWLKEIKPLKDSE